MSDPDELRKLAAWYLIQVNVSWRSLPQVLLVTACNDERWTT
jgi:hypothetical protein